eukprot:gene12963-biopygen2120
MVMVHSEHHTVWWWYTANTHANSVVACHTHASYQCSGSDDSAAFQCMDGGPFCTSRGSRGESPIPQTVA